MGDGDSKLIIADLSRQLRLFKGTTCCEDVKLLGQPVGLAITYVDEAAPRIPVLAVAAGSYIFIFRMLRPYHRWKCPDVKIVPAEIEIWKGLDDGSIDLPRALDLLGQTREAGHSLTSRSTELLCLPPDQQESLVNEMKGRKLVQQTIITCMGSIKRNSLDADAPTLLVVGTEANHVVILEQDISSTGFLCEVALPTTPTALCITGMFDVEWRINVAGRDGKIYSIKNGDKKGTAVLTGTVIDPGGSQVVAMARQDKHLWVADMERRLASFTVRGKRTKGLTTKDDIRDLLVAPVNKGKTGTVLLVGLADGCVSMYTTELELIHSFQVERPVVCMRFGSYGREECALVIIHGQSSSITTMVMRRLADLDALKKERATVTLAADVPISVPKKSKMFVEQCKREVAFAPAMHRAFQKDLSSLRLNTARAYVKTLTNANMVPEHPHESTHAHTRAHAHIHLCGLFELRRIAFAAVDFYGPYILYSRHGVPWCPSSSSL
jgi:Bardet-Biedl syndrome 1 protein